MAMPETSSKTDSLRTDLNSILCPVSSKYPASSKAAMTARYSASSPEETEIFRTNGPSVPNAHIAAISMALALFKRSIWTILSFPICNR